MTRWLAWILVILGSVPAFAQEESKVYVHLGGGMALPVSPRSFQEGWNPGLDVAVGVGFQLSPRLTLQLAVGYDRFASDEQGLLSVGIGDVGFDLAEIESGLDGGGPETEVVSVSGELEFRLIEETVRMSPYVLAGTGIARVTRADVVFAEPFPLPIHRLGPGSITLDPRFLGFQRTLEEISTSKPVIVVGGGIEVPVSKPVQLFVEGRYQITLTSEESTSHETFRGGVRIGL